MPAAPIIGRRPKAVAVVPCVHTWMTRDGANHVHACRGRESCHPGPCVCRCGALDYCTANRMRDATDPRHVATPPKGYQP